MDPEFDDMTLNLAYDIHGVPVRFDPGPASDVLVILHQPPAQQGSAAVLEFAGHLEVAEAFLTVLVRLSSFSADPAAAPAQETQVMFQRGPLAGKTFRVGQEPLEHGVYELRLTLQKVS